MRRAGPQDPRWPPVPAMAVGTLRPAAIRLAPAGPAAGGRIRRCVQPGRGNAPRIDDGPPCRHPNPVWTLLPHRQRCRAGCAAGACRRKEGRGGIVRGYWPRNMRREIMVNSSPGVAERSAARLPPPGHGIAWARPCRCTATADRLHQARCRRRDMGRFFGCHARCRHRARRGLALALRVAQIRPTPLPSSCMAPAPGRRFSGTHAVRDPASGA